MSDKLKRVLHEHKTKRGKTLGVFPRLKNQSFSRVLNLLLDPAASDRHKVTADRGGDHTDQARKDEGVVDHELTNMSCSGTVELDGSQVRRICRDDVVAIASRAAADNHTGRSTDADGNRNHDGDSSSLRVNELGN